MTEEEAVKAADELGYPVLVRPSYVLGGQGMEIAYKGRPMSVSSCRLSPATRLKPGSGR